MHGKLKRPAFCACRLQQGGLTRGIVIPAGGNVLLNHAWATITVLRESLNCSLPIEIIYNGPNEMDLWSIKKFEVLPFHPHVSIFGVAAWRRSA